VKTKYPDRLRKVLLRSIIFAVLLTSCLEGTQNVKGPGVLPGDNKTGLEQVDNVENGILQFKSGFEGTTHITGEISTTSSKENWIEGVDGSLGDWNSLKNGTNPNLNWVKYSYGWFQGGHMEIVQDPTGADNHVLRLRNTNIISGLSRAQWQLNQVKDYWNDDGQSNKFTQQFYRYRMYIPGDITTVPSYSSWSSWYMIWESHTWPQFSGGEKTRFGIYLQKNPNSSLWYFRVVQTRPEGCDDYEKPVTCDVYWDNKSHQNIPVPFDQWFTFEVFFKYSETDGEWYVAITKDGEQRQEIAHFLGRTKYDDKLHDQMIMKMYHSSAYLNAIGETNQYYDDLEIWGDYPPGYFAPSIVTPSLTPTLSITPAATSISPALP
jgi:hypothetical protein